MRQDALEPCVTVVSDAAAPRPDSGISLLPSTGIGPLPLVLLALAVVVIVGGILLLRRPRHGRLTAASIIAASGLAIGALAWAAPGPARADGAEGCSLIELSHVQRADAQTAGNLLPGQRAEVLTMTVSNVTSAPIDVRLSLDPTTGDPTVFAAEIIAGSGQVAAGLLAQPPSSAPLALAPGASLDVAVVIALASDTPETAGVTAAFDTVVTAISR